MTKDPHVWQDVADVLEEYVAELGEEIDSSDPDLQDRLLERQEYVRDVLDRYKREFKREFE